MTRILRRALPLLLLTFLVAYALPASARAANDITIPQARTLMLHLINVERANLNQPLIAVRNDKRLVKVSQARSDDMAQNDYFAHLSPYQLVAMVEHQHITWYTLGRSSPRTTTLT